MSKLRLVWVSDAHFNFVKRGRIKDCVKSFEDMGDAVIYTGDVGDGKSFEYVMGCISSGTKPAYYITGNHDYYHSSWSFIDNMCKSPKIKAICIENNGPIKLTDSSILVGAGGWSDGRSGDFLGSMVLIADHTLIKELAAHPIKSQAMLNVIQKRADAHQVILEFQLNEAIKLNPKVIYIATHSPIFIEISLAPNRIPSDKNWLPHFSWSGPRQMLVNIACSNPNINFISLAGHTHTYAEFRITNNLIARTAGARYNYPRVYDVLEVD